MKSGLAGKVMGTHARKKKGNKKQRGLMNGGSGGAGCDNCPRTPRNLGFGLSLPQGGGPLRGYGILANHEDVRSAFVCAGIQRFIKAAED